MKATGIVRRIDDLGRIVIPKELRRTYGIKEGDPLEIFAADDQLVLKKYLGAIPTCVRCGASENLIPDESIAICWKCAGKIAERVRQG